MELTPLGIQGAWLANSTVFRDDRGHFREWFKREEILSQTGFDFKVEQANISQSHQGVIRGIHYSLVPDGQSKWITCISGAIQDVIVDLRVKSPTFGTYISVLLSEGDGRAVLISSGLGHGFLALSDNTTVSYLLNSKYDPRHEVGIYPLDSELNINWKLESLKPIISEKDLEAQTFTEVKKSNLLPLFGV